MLAGCGTTRWSDSARTATEQLLISDALDHAVSQLDLRALAGKKVYFDTTYLRATIDADYLVSSLRQHALASGCIVKTNRDEADYVAEIRTGTVGTDRHDVLFGVPAASVPTGLGANATVPEIPFIKRTEQRAVAKLAIFAYNRVTGRPIWQSGIIPVESNAKDIWVFGAGPYKKGRIHRGMDYGEKLPIPVITPGDKQDAASLGEVSVAAQAYFTEPREPVEIARREPPPSPSLPDPRPPYQIPPAQNPSNPTVPGPGAALMGPNAVLPNGGLPPVQAEGDFLPKGHMPVQLQVPSTLPQTITSRLESTKK